MTNDRLSRRRLFYSAAAAAMTAAAAKATTGGSNETWPPPGFGAVPVPPRTPRYPLKTARTMTSEAELDRARNNIQRYPAARAIRDRIVKGAAVWLTWSDADLARLITPPAVPRAFDVGASIGCPKCGKTIHEKFGTYPWLVDLKKPFKLTCPVDGSVYPDNDYDAYLRSGFTTKKNWDAPVVDDGWGWKNPANDERYWFVAHYNHRVYHRHLLPGLNELYQAYLLTGEQRYAHKAAVILFHLAVVYPGMDHEKQSRFGLLTALQGGRYAGKILNHIWECQVADAFASAYDAVWATFDSDTALQQATGMNGPALRAFIEANLLEDAIDAYYTARIRGNFGMHQNALAHLAIARQHGENDRYFGDLMTAATTEDSCTGLEYALYNLTYRDGFGNETSPDYNMLWVNSLTALAPLLKKGGHDLFALPRMRRLYDAVIDQINCGRWTPDLGDTGSVYGALEGTNADTFQTAYDAYGDPRYARFLASFGAVGDNGFRTYDSLFRALPETKRNGKAALPPQRARVYDGYGLAVLSNPADTVSLSLYYGLKAGHGHFDRLGFELFTSHQPVMPDLGYPDAMNDFVPGIFTWSKNTVSHNTVVVDAGRQTGNVAGTVRLFADGKSARVVAIDAAGTYPQATTYRRALLMVDTSDAGSYYVDVFDVVGGAQHDYSLHGPPGAFELVGADVGSWSAPEPGTLAGREVAVGQIYDNSKMGAPGYRGGFTAYTGSGFQHLYNVRRYEKPGGTGEWAAEWRHEKDPASGLRLRVLPQPDGKEEMLLADARVSPVKFPQVLRYLIARRKGENLSSRFVSILEPFRERPLLAHAERMPLAQGGGVAVRVRRVDGQTDLLLYGPEGETKQWRAESGGLPEIRTNARAAVVTLGKDGTVQRIFFAGGTELTVGGKTHRAAPAVTGVVASVHPEKNQVQIRLEAESGTPSPTGGSVVFDNAHGRRALHPVTTARQESGRLWSLFLGDDLRLGRAHVAAVTPVGAGQSVRSDVALPLGPTYRGASLCDRDFTEYHPIADVSRRDIQLVEPLRAGGTKIAPGGDAYIVSVTPGDRVSIPALYEYTASAKTA